MGLRRESDHVVCHGLLHTTIFFSVVMTQNLTPRQPYRFFRVKKDYAQLTINNRPFTNSLMVRNSSLRLFTKYISCNAEYQIRVCDYYPREYSYLRM